MKILKQLAIIPARSGSKGLRDKNIKSLCGKPLMAYTIEAARNSGIFDIVMVSTDSQAYAEIAKQYGAEVPFLRSMENSSDHASSWDAVKEVLNRYEQMGIGFETVTLLQPTTPLRSAEDIKGALWEYREKKANAVVSVCETDYSPLWCNTLPADHSLCGFLRAGTDNARRQKLETYYRINGAIYMVNTDYLKNSSSIYESGCFAYLMERKHSIDIDDELDFTFAEVIMSKDPV